MKKRIVCLLIAMILLIPATVFYANAAAVKIGAITIDNLSEPVAGSTPDYSADVAYGAVDLYQSAHSTENGVIWRKIVNGSEYPMNKTDVFEYGKAYSVRIYVKRQTDEDFFADSIIGKIGDGLGNYVTADVRKLSSDPSVAVVMFIFECNKTAISSVAVNGVTEPAPDSRMNFEVTLGQNSNCDLSQDGRLVFWVDEKTGTSYSDNKINDFAEGKVYTIQIYLEPKSGYAFPDNLEKVIATVNGQRAELKYDEKNSLYFIQKRFDTCGSVESIEVNYAAPVVGQLPSFDKVENYRYESKNAGVSSQSVNGISWYDETAGKYLKGTGEMFLSHHTYSVTFEIQSKMYTVQTAQGNVDKYYEFINSSATINGEPVDDKNISLVTGDRAWKYATVKYTFAPLDECSPAAVSKKEATCTENGNIAHYVCTCGKLYKDEAGTQEITDKNSVVIAATGHKYDNACDTTCNNCSATRTITHDYAAATCTAPAICKVCKTTSGKALGHKYDNACDTTCNNCSATRTITHDYAPATCTAPAICKVCKTTSGKALGHKYDNACDATCNNCSETRTIAHDYAAATCTAPKTCNVCGATSGKALGHNKDKGTVTKKATYTATGTKTYKCTVCKAVVKTEKISRLTLSKVTKLKATPSATSIKFSWAKVKGAQKYEVYYSTNGKKWTKVTSTKNSAIVKLKSGTTYKVKVRAVAGSNNGAYSTVLTTSTKPATVTLSMVTAGTKQATVAWKTVTGASGYQVQYSTSSKFKSAKTATVKKGSSKKTTIKKLTKGKKYYFKVRAYKTVNGKKVYGAWSSVKSVKVK